MPQPTAYQYVKLGSNVEYLRGISTTSVMQTTSLAASPHLLENLSTQRYSVSNVSSAVRSLLVQLEEMGLARSLGIAEPFRPMLKEMEDYLARLKPTQSAFLNDPFAERLVALSQHVGSAVRSELGMADAIVALPVGDVDSDAS